MSNVKSPDTENNSISHCNIVKASLSSYELLVGIHKSCVLFVTEFCASVILFYGRTFGKSETGGKVARV
jgi:hypothetical protein